MGDRLAVGLSLYLFIASWGYLCLFKFYFSVALRTTGNVFMHLSPLFSNFGYVPHEIHGRNYNQRKECGKCQSENNCPRQWSPNYCTQTTEVNIRIERFK